MGTTGVTSRRDAEQKIIEQAARDQEFRSKLLSDPQPAVERAIGMKLPEGVKITVLQETDRQLYLVLPAPAARQDGELTESELSSVAGGIDARQANKAKALPGLPMNPGDVQNDLQQKVQGFGG